MRLNHHRAGQWLSPFLDGELLPADATAVQEHLLECRACREAYDRLRATKALLSELPLAEPPAEFWPVVRGSEPRRLPLPARFGVPAKWPPRWWPRMAWAVAAIVVLALALTPFIKGTVDRLHAAEVGVDLYVREHALQMGTQPLTDRAYLGVIVGDADLVLVGEPDRARGTAP